MKFRLTICLTLFLLMGLRVTSQIATQQIESVNLGEVVPDYMLTNLINFPEPKVNLNSFKGKVLIVDFWDFYCTACVKSWPKLMSLQEQFKNKIQILLVNTENNVQDVQVFIDKQEKIHKYKMSLPIVCGDKNLKKIFPHNLYPHVVYIDSSGIVKYFTTNVTEGLIQAVLDNKQLNLPAKMDDLLDINWSEPMFLSKDLSKDAFVSSIYSEIVIPYSPKIRPGADFVDSKLNVLNGRPYGVMSNWPLQSMFQYLYGRDYNKAHHVYSVPKSKIVFRDVDTNRLVRTVGGIPQSQNLYTIQVTSKKNIPIEDIRKRMIMALEKNFDLKTGWEQQKKQCLVISKSGSPITVYKEGLDSLNIDGKILNFNNITMQDLIDRLTHFTPSLKKYPVVDETNYKGILGNIKLQPKDVINYLTLGEALSKHGMKITIQEREVRMLVITNSNSKIF